MYLRFALKNFAKQPNLNMFYFINFYIYILFVFMSLTLELQTLKQIYQCVFTIHIIKIPWALLKNEKNLNETKNFFKACIFSHEAAQSQDANTNT